ncbi:shikimate 5-dehydrogenase [Aeromonas diversa CDC 2478-85]|uniref:Shikimate dehydrogenase (NADP(+)) n=1 Tax=Aeromonas diversa CDC 2478-85 TaxID=1268237 RepID=N9U274_9GAMM|nr:shikimate dehydrogenase [Aeromonas diversa]ENY72474.1 shikimate 5-dehydrogenase [Aeromonas diversa CDC 2478-85]
MDRYLVVGNPVRHSKSPFIHTLFARQTQQEMEYSLCEPPLDGFADALRLFFARGGKGCNVTVPFKEQAFAMATELTERARRAGAVNTLVMTERGEVLGDNTDGAGLVADLKQQQVELADARILLLGAGGAARGALAPLLAERPRSLVIANRTQSKAELLATEFGELGAVSASSFEALEGPFDLIINSTSASLAGEVPPLAPLLIHGQLTVYDMMYGPGDTPFNAWARAEGAGRVIDGLGMLVEQAAEAFSLWRGIRPGSRQVLRELRRQLG